MKKYCLLILTLCLVLASGSALAMRVPDAVDMTAFEALESRWPQLSYTEENGQLILRITDQREVAYALVNFKNGMA